MKKIDLKLFAFCIISLFVIKINAQVVSTFAGSGISGSNDATGTLATFKYPVGVCSDASGNVYVADYQNYKIRKITPTGVVTTFAGSGVSGSIDGTGTAASFTGPSGICFDALGNLFVSDYSAQKIRKITPAGVVTTFAGSGAQGNTNGTGTSASFKWPAGMCIDPSGNIYVTESGNNDVRKITPAGVVTTFATGFLGPQGICIDASGNLYVTGALSNVIYKVTPSGVVSTFAGSGIAGNASGTGTAASFNNPLGICIDPSGNIYIAEGNHFIRKITSTAVVTTFAGTGAIGNNNGALLTATFSDPESICIDPFGNFYIADTYNHSIRKIAPACSAPSAPTNSTPSSNQTLCENNTTILSATSTGTVNWYSTPTSTTVLASGTSYTTSVLPAGTYTYYAEASTCTVSATRTSITVTVNTLPTISVNSGSICSGNSFTINPTGANTYTVSGGSSVVSPTSNTSYSITGTSVDGCLSSNTAISSVSVNALPSLSVTSTNNLMCTGESATLTVTGANTYTWNTTSNSNAISISPTVTTTYTVNGIDANGCENMSTITQIVSLCTGLVSIQKGNLISIFPNPSNGIFTISGIEQNTTISIYSTIGALVKSIQSTENNTTIDLSNYSNGIYFIKIKNNYREAIQKLIKQ